MGRVSGNFYVPPWPAQDPAIFAAGLLLWFFFYKCFSVGCLWHSHGKNPVRSYPKLQSQPIGLPKIFIDYLFLQADQSDCTKSVSIFNRYAFSEESRNQNAPCQICRP